MTKTINPTLCGTLAILLLATPILRAQQVDTVKPEADKAKKAVLPQAPVPAQIVTGKKVFVAYGGGESNFRPGGYSGDVDRTYDQFYAALKSWGHYELVSAPAEAELVFEVSFVNPLIGTRVSSGGGTTAVNSESQRDPQLKLVIIDLKTHVVLWALTQHVEFGWRQESRDKNFDQAMAALVNDVARLAGTPPAFAAAAKKTEGDTN